MNEDFLDKMLNKTLEKYFGDENQMPFSEEEIAALKTEIIAAQKNDPKEALYIIVEDIVYGYLTQ